VIHPGSFLSSDSYQNSSTSPGFCSPDTSSLTAVVMCDSVFCPGLNVPMSPVSLDQLWVKASTIASDGEDEAQTHMRAHPHQDQSQTALPLSFRNARRL